MLNILDLDYKVEGAARAGAKRVFCPYGNYLDYYHDPHHRQVAGVVVKGVEYAWELLLECLHLPAGPNTGHRSAAKKQRLFGTEGDLSEGCALGHFWGPMYANRLDEMPKGWRQDVYIVCVPARKDAKLGEVLIISNCSEDNLNSLDNAKAWARLYSHHIQKLVPDHPLRLDLTNEEYDWVMSLPPSNARRGSTPFSATIYVATISLLTGLRASDQVGAEMGKGPR